MKSIDRMELDDDENRLECVRSISAFMKDELADWLLIGRKVGERSRRRGRRWGVLRTWSRWILGRIGVMAWVCCEAAGVCVSDE